MVSISIFLFLGIMLVSVFKSGLDMWHAGEAGKIQFQRARNVLAIIREDLQSMCTADHFRPDGTEVDIRLVADLIDTEGGGRQVQRVRFVRRIPDELQNRTLRSAGEYDFTKTQSGPLQMSYYDGFSDRDEFLNRELANSGGMMEVGYLLRDEQLYRGVKAPVGYYYEASGVKRRLSLFEGEYFFGNTDDGGAFNDAILENNARILADNVLHFEMRFWAPDTEDWTITEPARLPDDATHEWDSTCDNTNAFPFVEDFAGFRVGDPTDDLFPAKVKVVLVIDTEPRSRKMARLVNDGSLKCADTRGFIKGEPERQYIKVDQEWIRYSDIVNDEFIVDRRAVRFTSTADLDKNDEVYQGKLFTMVIDVPGITNDQ